MPDSRRSPLYQFAIPILLVAIVCVSGVLTLGMGGTLVGDPSAEFLVVVAACVVGFVAWLKWWPGLSRSVRTISLIFVLLVPLVTVLSLNIDLVDSWTSFWRGTQRYATELAPPPPPPKFEYLHPTSAATPDFSRVTETDWPSYRGVHRDGIVRGITLADDWKKSPPKLLWKHPSGGGVASPVIVGDYVIIHEQRGPYETVACLELATGSQCWVHEDEANAFEGNTGVGPKATPAVVNGNVISYGGTGILNCLDGRTGSVIWTKKVLGKDIHPPMFGLTSSPLVADGAVFVSLGDKGPTLAAFDLQTGDKIWDHKGAPPSYSSLHYSEVCGKPFLLMFNTMGLDAHDPRTGKVHWHIEWKCVSGGNHIAQPIVVPLAENTSGVFLTSAYDVGCGLFEISQLDGAFQVKERYRNRRLRAKYSSVVNFNRMIIGLDEIFLVGVDLETGERKWKHGDRFGFGQVLLAGDRLLIQAEDGKLILGEPTSSGFRELASIRTPIERTWNVPAMKGDKIVLKTSNAVVCYQLPTVPNR